MQRLKFKYRIAVFLIDLLSKTWRIKIAGNKPPKPGVILFWHGKMLPVWKFFANDHPIGVVSKSNDGAVLSALLEKWNFKLIRGSSSKEGKIVLQEMTTNAPGNYLLITPDGPRGPKNKMKAGGVVTAHRASVPLYLCGTNINKKFIFNKSWDNFYLPMPFTSIILSFSGEYFIERDSDKSDVDRYISNFENKLNVMDVD